MSNPIKAPANYLRDSGLLFEINRQVLHPLGLALAIVIPSDDSDTGSFQLLDAEDPEGWIYAEETYADGQNKLDAFLMEHPPVHKPQKSA